MESANDNFTTREWRKKGNYEVYINIRWIIISSWPMLSALWSEYPCKTGPRKSWGNSARRVVSRFINFWEFFGYIIHGCRHRFASPAINGGSKNGTRVCARANNCHGTFESKRLHRVCAHVASGAQAEMPGRFLRSDRALSCLDCTKFPES